MRLLLMLTFLMPFTCVGQLFGLVGQKPVDLLFKSWKAIWLGETLI